MWHWPGKSQISGDLKGKEAVFEAFGKLNEMTGGNIKLEDRDFLASDDRSVALSRVVEEWVFLDDQYAYDEFWP